MYNIFIIWRESPEGCKGDEVELCNLQYLHFIIRLPTQSTTTNIYFTTATVFLNIDDRIYDKMENILRIFEPELDTSRASVLIGTLNGLSLGVQFIY